MPTRRDDLPAKGPRPFTNREDKIEAFWHLFDNMTLREYNVLSLYGVAGVGKSRLREELITQIRKSAFAESTIISDVLDFDTRDNQPSLQNLERALYALRNELNRKRVRFLTFDIAFAHYWEKTHPEVVLQQKDIPFIEEGSALIDIFGGAKDLVPAIGEFSTWIAGAGILTKATELLKTIGTADHNRMVIRSVEQLQSLGTKSIQELLSELIYFLAYDINEYFKKTGSRIVFFVDTYEALWESGPQKQSAINWSTRDAWVRRLITEIPNTLWVISGKNLLRWQELKDWPDEGWAEWIEEIEVKELTESDSEQYLQGCEITNYAIRSRIYKSSMGLPFAMELQVDQYERIVKTREPLVGDFTDIPKKVIQRFTEFLSLEELQTLNVLSVSRVWDSVLFRELIKQFNTGYPATALDELSRFSFITQEGNQYRMHGLMRDELQTRLNHELLQECRQFLFRFYDQKLELVTSWSMSSELEFALEEAFYQRVNINNFLEATQWFIARWEKFRLGNRWELWLRLAYELKMSWELQPYYDNNQLYASLLQTIGRLHEQQGQYRDSLICYQQALSIIQSLSGFSVRLGSAYTYVGRAYERLGEPDQAYRYYLFALPIFLTLGGEDTNTASLLNYIGIYHHHNLREYVAIAHFRKALEIFSNTLGRQHLEIANVLINMGNAYNGLDKHILAFFNYQEAFQIRLKILGKEHSDTGQAISNIGLAYSGLGDYAQAINKHVQALIIFRDTLGDQHPDTAKSLINVGLAYFRETNFDQTLIHFKARSRYLSDCIR